MFNDGSDVGKMVRVPGDDVQLDGKPLRVIWSDETRTNLTGKIKHVSTDEVHLENGQWFRNPSLIDCTNPFLYRKRAWPCCPLIMSSTIMRSCVLSAINMEVSQTQQRNMDLGDSTGATKFIADWITIRGMRAVCIPITLLYFIPDV